MELEISRQVFERNNQISNITKIPPVETELCHVNRQKWRRQKSLFAILRTSLKGRNNSHTGIVTY